MATSTNALYNSLCDIIAGKSNDGDTSTKGDAMEIDDPSDHPPVRIFVSGDQSQVGKSSVCMGLIGTLVHELGYDPSSLAYIKPATQCEATQLVALYCEDLGVDHRAVGPIVYYKGFTRAFLAGEAEYSTQELLQQAGEAVDAMLGDDNTTTTTNNNNNVKKRIVIVDGVGYPAVGSICGTDNAAVASACGPKINTNTANNTKQTRRLPVPVLLVGKSGVGDAVDSFNLNATYFKARGVPVLGAVFNRLPLEGYYSLENCKEAVGSYFENTRRNDGESNNDKHVAFGFIPEVSSISSSREEGTALELESAKQFVETFAKHVDVRAIVEAAVEASKRAAAAIDATTTIVDTSRGTTTSFNNTKNNNKRIAAGRRKIQPITRVLSENATSSTTTKRPKINGSRPIGLTREQVEEAARRAGAAGG